MFLWIFSFTVSLLLLIIGATGFFLSGRVIRAGKKINAFYWLAIAVFLSAVVMFLPIYGDIFLEEPLRGLKTFILSIHNTVRLFVVDSDFDIILDHTGMLPVAFCTAYRVLCAVLFLGCPLLTFSLVLTFFQRVLSHWALRFRKVDRYYIFSELNEEALALAKSLEGKQNERYLSIFCEVGEETDYEIKNRVKELGGVCLEEDITSIKLRRDVKKSYFFIAAEDDKNLDQAIAVCEQEKTHQDVDAYVFAESAKSELVLNAVDKGNVRVRRIAVPRALIYRALYEQGSDLFAGARDEGDKKRISAVVVGLGAYGWEMAKALVWACQMYGYEFELHCFDEDVRQEHRFNVECPELISCSKGENPADPISKYDLHIYAGEKNYSAAWFAHMEKIAPTFIFIDQGKEGDNLQMAIDLRTYFAGKGLSPKIQTIAENSDEIALLGKAKNFKGQEYNISFIGDTKSCYSMEVILNSEVEQAGLIRHLAWGKEEEFWNYSYNYTSSIASAIHKKLRIACGVPGADKAPADRTEEEKDIIRRQEHDRWNAFMRTEGYSYAPVRNDLAKKHTLLVPFDDLPPKEQKKDDD